MVDEITDSEEAYWVEIEHRRQQLVQATDYNCQQKRKI